MKTYDVMINGDKTEKTVCLVFFDQTEDSNDAMEIRVPITWDKESKIWIKFETAKMLREYLNVVIEAIEHA